MHNNSAILVWEAGNGGHDAFEDFPRLEPGAEPGASCWGQSKKELPPEANNYIVVFFAKANKPICSLSLKKKTVSP